MSDKTNILIFAFYCFIVVLSIFGIEKNSIEDLNKGIDDGIAVVVEILLMLLGIIIIGFLAEPDDKTLLVRLFLLSFSLRILFSVIVYKFGLINVLGFEDATGWAGGWELARRWREGALYPSTDQGGFWEDLKSERSSIGYRYFSGMILYILGSPSIFSLALFNCLFGALTVLLIYGIAKMILGKETATVAAIFAVVFPSLIVWSAQTSKEPIVLFLELLILYALLKLRHKMRLSLMFLIPASIIALFLFRFYAAFVCIFVIIGLIMQTKKLEPRMAFVKIIWFSTIIILVSTIIALFFTMGVWKAQIENISSFSPNFIQSYKQGFYSPSPTPGYFSSVRLPFDVSTPTGALLSLPIGFLYLMLSPFPWDLIGGSLRMKLTLPELLLWWCLIYYGIIGLRYALKKKLAEVYPILLFFAIFSILYSLLFSNIGVIYRQRTHIMPVIIIFAALGVVLRKQKKAPVEQPGSEDTTQLIIDG